MRPFSERRLISMWEQSHDSACDVFWRHDIDVCLDSALWMANLEHIHGISATYYLCVESPGYNLFAASTGRVMRRLVNLGHRIGLHAVAMNPGAEDDIRGQLDMLREYAPTSVPTTTYSVHHPAPALLWRDVAPHLEYTYAEHWRDHYTSDSEPFPWRSGEPEDLFHQLPRLQVLIHPLNWRGGIDEWNGHRTAHELAAMHEFLDLSS